MKINEREYAALLYLTEHPTIYAGTVKGVSFGTLYALLHKSYIEQNPGSPLGNYRLTAKGRTIMKLRHK